MRHLTWLPRIVVFLLCGWVAVSGSTAQQERVEVSLRLLDVVVTDRKGRPMVGLQPEDFVVLVDGAPREIHSFDVTATPSSSVPVSDPSTDPDPSPSLDSRNASDPGGRSIVILLDADRIPHNYRKNVLETARAVVRESGGPRDRFAIALLRNGELHFLQSFAPRDQIQIGLLEDPGMLLGRADDLRYRLDDLVDLLEGCSDSSVPDSCVLTRSEEFLAVLRQETARGLVSLRGLVAAMAPLPGRKALVWFSNGLLLEPGQIVLDVVTRYVGDTRFIASRLEDRADRRYESLLSEATRARVSVFSLRAGHDMGQAIHGADRAGNPRRLAGEGANPYRLATSLTEDSLRDAADATGGRLILTPLGPKLAPDLLEQLRAIYTLGIRPGPGDRPGSRVKVKLAAKKGKVRQRPRLPVVGRPPQNVKFRLDQPRVAERDQGVGILVSLDLSSIHVEKDSETAIENSRIAVFARILEADGSEVENYYEILQVPRGSGVDQEFEHRIPLPLPPGDHLAEVTISDLIGKGITSRTMEIRP